MKILNKVLKKLLYSILIFFIIISFIISGTVTYLLATNYNNLGQAISIFTLIKAQAIQPISNSELIEGAVKGMVESLGDPYSEFLNVNTFDTLQERMRGTYGGVGLLITKDEDGNLVVVSPFKGTPAHRKGIASGDAIIKINDEETKDMDLETAASLMQGEPGTEVNLTVIREGQEPREVVLVREDITIPTVEGAIIKDVPDIAYIHLSMFNEKTGQDLVNELNELSQEGFKGLVLDLRDNPGGSLFSAVEVADVFVPEGPVVHILSKFSRDTYTASGPPIDVPLVVLVNSGSASASEIVAGAIQDTGVGVLVGEKTFGKGLVQSLFPLSDGAALKLTTAKYLTPNERDINKKGIEPDYEVILSVEETVEALQNAPDPKIDRQLQKAIEILQEQIAN